MKTTEQRLIGISRRIEEMRHEKVRYREEIEALNDLYVTLRDIRSRQLVNMSGIQAADCRKG